MKGRTLLLPLMVLAGARGQAIVGPPGSQQFAQQFFQRNNAPPGSNWIADPAISGQDPRQISVPPGSVSGHVVNSITGAPVRQANVVLQNSSRGGNFQSATTDSAGAFSAGNLQPGDYLVQVSHPNYQGILGIQNQSQTVTVSSAEESSGVTLRLMPGGTISGKVLDDGGEPVTGCPIWALGPGPGAGSAPYVQKGNATTNDKGEYKFDALTADRYLLYARCQESLPVERPLAVWRPELIQPAESWLPVYFPGNASPEGAQWLTVLPGREVSGVDFKLRSTPVTTVSGTLGGVSPGTQVNLQLIPSDSAQDASLAYGASVDPANSTFQFQMVHPGSYRLVAISSSGQPDTLAYASIPVTVGRVRPSPLLVQMHPGLTVSGVVELPPSDPSGGNVAAMPTLQASGRQTPKEPPVGFLTLNPLSQTSYTGMRQVELHRDGAFTVQGLMPGRYKVNVQIWAPRQASLESVQFGTSQAEHGVIELSEGSSGTMRVRAAGTPVQLTVSLADAPTGSRGDWWIFALPADGPAVPATAANQSVLAAGKSGDTLRLQNANAGKFAFVAVEMMMVNAVQNEPLAHLLLERAELVEVAAGQDRSVSPKFFTSAEIEKLALAYLQGETR